MPARLIALCCCLLAVAGGAWYLYSSQQKPAQPLAEPTPQTPRIVAALPSPYGPPVRPAEVPATPVLITTTSTSSITSAEHPGMKLYRNDEYGFEFWYPEKWNTSINEDGLGASSVFEMVAAPDAINHGVFPFLVNVVEPQFADVTFAGYDKSPEPITIDGVVGKEYRYEFEDSPEKAIVLPLGKYKIILGTTKDYMQIFDEIMLTFKITK